ncbi:hypothetical protein KI387_010165, partial [Taxus chinensis]
ACAWKEEFMGLLDKLWDDTVAGPQPDNGLGKLRRSTTINIPAHSALPEADEAVRRLRERRSSAEIERSSEEATQVTRSITMLKPPYLRNISVDNSDVPSSPSASSPPVSPYSLTPRERENPWRTPRTPTKMGSGKREKAEPRSPTVYD